MTRSAGVVICGAGILGISAAYYLSKAGVKDIILVDERPPLSLTSDRSTECYRNWWQDSAMLNLMNRSIDLMEKLAEESNNIFNMNRRGYLYATAVEEKIPALIERSKRTSSLGAGPVRVHTADNSSYQPAPAEGFANQPNGADLLLGAELIHKHFPYLNENTCAVLHARRAGWLSAQQLGMYLLEGARKLGVKVEAARVIGVNVEGGKIRAVKLSNGEEINTSIFVNAAGPFLKEVGAMLGVEIPIVTETHLKASIKDSLGVLQRNAPLLIWDDEQMLQWSKEEKAELQTDESTAWLTEKFPAGAHSRPEGAGDSLTILLLWEYKTKINEPIFPIEMDEQYPEVALRGLSAMLPRLKEYFEKMPRPHLDGGYYTRTRENLPLVGKLAVEGAYIIGAASGYGIMSACGLGELLAKEITNASLPSYTLAFDPSRYKDPEYQKRLQQWSDIGQL